MPISSLLNHRSRADKSWDACWITTPPISPGFTAFWRVSVRYPSSSVSEDEGSLLSAADDGSVPMFLKCILFPCEWDGSSHSGASDKTVQVWFSSTVTIIIVHWRQTWTPRLKLKTRLWCSVAMLSQCHREKLLYKGLLHTSNAKDDLSP